MTNEPIHSFRRRELTAIYRFIDNSRTDEIAQILNEIRVCHGLFVFDKDSKSMKKVESICINCDIVQLNTEEWHSL